MSLSNYFEDRICNTIRGQSYSVATTYVQLHVGDPGEDGISNPAQNTSRVQVTFAAPANGVLTSSTEVVFANVPATETYTHGSVWDSQTGGNCLFSGAFGSARSVSSGGSLSLPAGSVSVTLN